MASRTLYRTIWRWHFFAGLIVLPVLAWMAITGSLYLYKPEIERWLYHDWVVTKTEAPPLPVAEMIARVEARTGGRVTQVVRPTAEQESWRLSYSVPEGEGRMAFVRPDTGAVLGAAPVGGPLEIVKELHSLTVAGPVGNVVVEIVAGWAILLVLTGFYLWWPRSGNRALSLAGRIGERRFWRNLHASVGALVGAVLLFLAVTGMPWTIFWGANFHAFVAAQGIGRPPPPASAMPASGGHGHDAHLPWALQGAPPPAASLHDDIGPDRALAVGEGAGISAPWILDLPAAPGAPYRVSTAAERTDDVRVVQIDPGDGRVLQDIAFADFGIGAQVFQWGIYTHQGQQYGALNRLVMLAGCIGLLMLTLSAPVMWWKRRRDGRLRAPPPDDGAGRGAAGILIAVGLLFPLTGLTMVAAWLLGWIVPRS